MVTLDDLTAFLNDFMGDVGEKDPHMPNGLQVRGREEVKFIATGVSASLRLFEEAVGQQNRPRLGTSYAEGGTGQCLTSGRRWRARRFVTRRLI